VCRRSWKTIPPGVFWPYGISASSHANRRPEWASGWKELKGAPHHLTCVRKFVLLASAALLVVVLSNADRVGVPDPFRKAVRGVTLPFKVAALYVKEPDGRLAVPVEGVRVKQIGDSWHASRSGGRLHEGQDIFARRGTAVYSATKGYVVRVGENALGGNTVFVLGAGGRSYYYAHLDAYAPGLALGDYVTPETVLGYVGTTGNAAGGLPHLHFGVYTTAGAIDPLPLLSNRD
jgi:murein DD-endopeptidase MepM/ murein hydrolase activator NlpD